MNHKKEFLVLQEQLVKAAQEARVRVSHLSHKDRQILLKKARELLVQQGYKPDLDKKPKRLYSRPVT